MFRWGEGRTETGAVRTDRHCDGVQDHGSKQWYDRKLRLLLKLNVFSHNLSTQMA